MVWKFALSHEWFFEVSSFNDSLTIHFFPVKKHFSPAKTPTLKIIPIAVNQLPPEVRTSFYHKSDLKTHEKSSEYNPKTQEDIALYRKAFH